MASRRTRIKGIANIPPRRKTETKVVEESSTIELSDKAPDEKCNENNNNALHVESELVSVEVHSTQNDTNVLANHQLSSITKPPLDQSEKPIVSRRTFIKPLVNLKSLTKQKSEEVPKINVPQTPLSSVQLANKEVEISASAQTISNSDSENIPEPQSPIKIINRSRIKAIPRLTQRRISSTVHGSASESEDDTNKKSYKRIRTESACSTASTSNDNFARAEPELPQKPRDFNTVIQRKCRRTEQSNKMAEARRNFINKFRNKDRDKNKLTMLDLIFYNPTTKPMRQNYQKPEKSDVRKSIEDNPQECEEEQVESDEENHVPAPQIKIGANGEIVVDEQSLIIENKQTKKDRENLQKSEVVDGDFDTGYGIYKRAKRSKDWSKDDTLFFYKVLNTLGTDFSLMVQLFPGRSRRELKMKFKKEEKINHALIDKALTRPLQFNIKDLKEEAKVREKMKELDRVEKEEKLKQLQAQKKDTILPYKRRGAKKDRKTKTKKRVTKRKDIYSKIEKGIASVWDSDDEDESIEDGDKEDEDESDGSTAASTDVSNIFKPTRYGRIPKQKVLTLEDPKVFKIREEHVQEEHQLEPGSLMVVCSQAPTGLQSFKVFMVTGNQTKVPVIIPSDVLTTLMRSIGDASTTEEEIPENNYTICHNDTNNKAIEVQIQDIQENNSNTITS
ncbi:hypothetical protein FQR65_LT03120 [Abscondita terminalis]|nr:hypothetical protein FQR65_LT03120 [Abscondita terminalis]